jgi:hypothetical protein
MAISMNLTKVGVFFNRGMTSRASVEKEMKIHDLGWAVRALGSYITIRVVKFKQ